MKALTQWDFTAPFEGIIPHMYMDTAGYVTAGVGFMLPNLGAAQHLPWDGSESDISRDWYAVRALGPGLLPYRYKAVTTCRLSDTFMREEFARKTVLLSFELAKIWPGFDAFPRAAQLAIRDMAFNVGVGGLRRHWPKFRAAIERQDWAKAAEQCNRRGIQESRNDATRAAFLSCVLPVS
jgi:GH24 family phage-related lysozyme (muramidase)